MKKRIKVSAHQFKNKEAATREVERILKNRQDRIEKIMKVQKNQEQVLKEADAKLESAIYKRDKAIDEAKEKAIADLELLKSLADTTKKIKSEHKSMIDLLEKQRDNEYATLKSVKAITKPIRNRYRHKNKWVYVNYALIGKNSKSGQWVFEAKEN
ncbi:MAG: hypothetical protein ABIJ40_03485 [Bacteroidota bacterium]